MDTKVYTLIPISCLFLGSASKQKVGQNTEWFRRHRGGLKIHRPMNLVVQLRGKARGVAKKQQGSYLRVDGPKGRPKGIRGPKRTGKDSVADSDTNNYQAMEYNLKVL